MSRLQRGGRGRERERKLGNRDEKLGTCLIITEGTETEVNYFENIKNIINTKYRKREIQENYPMKVEGKGRSTSVLVNEAIKRKNRENFSEIWIVFDKDDNTDFDNAIELAKVNNINVAWSNQSFELWLLLHFKDLKVEISRAQYIKELNTIFKKQKINGGIYNKNISNIFDITYENINSALKRSKSLRKEQERLGEKHPSKMSPGTTVDILVEKLIEYLK
ncbi:RloB family protein [uncultured Clostridium sp.]|uniref:RloB family protein n=1 Tax=uncultured Clostridium sp. TaxID=59620 RepID=UPI00261AF57E|nr:RloB family protein [uncultured Clostridium sp.]